MTSATALKFPVAPGSLELVKRVGNQESFLICRILQKAEQWNRPLDILSRSKNTKTTFSAAEAVRVALHIA